MQRRKFVAGVGLGATALGLNACGSDTQNNSGANKVQAGKTYRWTMVTTWPKGFQVLGESADYLAQLIGQMSGGRIQIKVLGAGELVPAMEVFDSVSQGTAEMGHGASYYWKGKMAASPFFSAVPFGLTAQEMNAWLYYGGGNELWKELYQPFAVLPFSVGNSGTQMAGWFQKEINSLADIQGLKMRIPGMGGEVLAKAGGEPVLMPGGQVFTSLEQGVIDAAEWVGPANDLAFGFHKIAKNYYYPGWHEPGTNMEAIINKKAFEALPEDLQAIVSAACEAVNMRLTSDFTARNNRALTELVNTHGVQVKRLPDEVLEEFKAISETIVRDSAKENELSQRILQSFIDFKQDVLQWSKIGEQAFMNVRSG